MVLPVSKLIEKTEIICDYGTIYLFCSLTVFSLNNKQLGRFARMGCVFVCKYNDT